VQIAYVFCARKQELQMRKDKKPANRLDVKPPAVPVSMLTPSVQNRPATQSSVPKDLSDLLDYLEGYYGDDEGRFDATHLWPWRNLPYTRRTMNERVLRIILKRLLAPKASLEQHWIRLHADVHEHRRRRKASGNLASANAGDMVLNAVLDALLPVREVSAKEMASLMRNTSRAAADLSACLALLRNTGMNIQELLPTGEAFPHADEENGSGESEDAYADARFFIHMKLPRSLTHDQRGDITSHALRIVMGDPLVVMGILGRVAETARVYKVKRHNLSGRQRFAYVMATHMVRDSIRFFGAPRYERAEAFAMAASGVRVKGLRQMMEREKKIPATEGAKRRRAQLRGS
jgi:hypothetical protein